MKDSLRKAAAAAAHRTPPALSTAQVGELKKVVQRCRGNLDALRTRGEKTPVHPFYLQQKERALAEAIISHDTAVRRFKVSRQEQP